MDKENQNALQNFYYTPSVDAPTCPDRTLGSWRLRGGWILFAVDSQERDELLETAFGVDAVELWYPDADFDISKKRLRITCRSTEKF